MMSYVHGTREQRSPIPLAAGVFGPSSQVCSKTETKTRYEGKVSTVNHAIDRLLARFRVNQRQRLTGTYKHRVEHTAKVCRRNL